MKRALEMALVLTVISGISGMAQTAPKTPPTSSSKAGKPASVKVPPAIDAAFKKAFPTATIKNVSKETENGRQQYEVESVDQGKSRDVTYLADGTLLEIEDELSEAEFPPAVTAAINAKYPKATVTKREKLTIVKGNVVQYEAELKGAPVKEVVLTASGTWVSPK